MAATAKELKQWMNDLKDDAVLAVDEDGLTLVLVDDHSYYFELGGDPNHDPNENNDE